MTTSRRTMWHTSGTADQHRARWENEHEKWSNRYDRDEDGCWLGPCMTSPDDKRVDLLLVAVGDVGCGLRCEDVIEVHQAVRVSPLPEAPSVVEGVIDVRGEVIAVLDVRSRLGQPRRDLSVSDHLVVARVGRRAVALRVDRAERTVTVSASDVLPIEEVAGAVPHSTGLARLPNGIVVIQDLGAFLSADEDVLLERALGATRQNGLTR